MGGRARRAGRRDAQRRAAPDAPAGAAVVGRVPRRAPPRARHRRSPRLGPLVPLGLVAYCAYLAADGGSWHAPFAAQDVWHRAFKGPWTGDRRRRDRRVGRRCASSLHGPPTPVYFDRAGGDAIAIGRHNVALFAVPRARRSSALDRRVPAPAARPRRLRAVRAAAAAVLPGRPAAADVAAALRGRPLPAVPVAGLVAGARRRALARALVLGVVRASGLAACSALFSTWHWVA